MEVVSMSGSRKADYSKGLPSKQAFNGMQLGLFQDFLCNSPDQRENYSNTIELWDGIPKYYVSRQQMKQQRSSEGHLPTISREFRHGDRRFKIEIKPARITQKDNKTVEFYPSAREELVEDALRKIAAEQSQGFLDQEQCGVVFSLYQLRRELSDRGHPMPYPQVVEALDIMANCSIKVTSLDDDLVYQSPVLTSLFRDLVSFPGRRACRADVRASLIRGRYDCLTGCQCRRFQIWMPCLSTS